MSFSFPSLLFHEGRTYGQPEVVPISLPQVATGLRSRLPGSFRRRGFQPDLLMPQEALFARGAHSMQAAMRRALLRRGRSGNTAFSKTESNVAGNLCRMCRKGESRHGDFSLHNQNTICFFDDLTYLLIYIHLHHISFPARKLTCSSFCIHHFISFFISDSTLFILLDFYFFTC